MDFFLMLDQIIQIIATSKVRYEGELMAIDSSNRRISLKNVVSFGTEGRRPGNEIMPSTAFYDYIHFKIEDIDKIFTNQAQAQPNNAMPQSYPSTTQKKTSKKPQRQNKFLVAAQDAKINGYFSQQRQPQQQYQQSSFQWPQQLQRKADSVNTRQLQPNSHNMLWQMNDLRNQENQTQKQSHSDFNTLLANQSQADAMLHQQYQQSGQTTATKKKTKVLNSKSKCICKHNTNDQVCYQSECDSKRRLLTDSNRDQKKKKAKHNIKDNNNFQNQSQDYNACNKQNRNANKGCLDNHNNYYNQNEYQNSNDNNNDSSRELFLQKREFNTELGASENQENRIFDNSNNRTHNSKGKNNSKNRFDQLKTHFLYICRSENQLADNILQGQRTNHNSKYAQNQEEVEDLVQNQC